MTLYWFLLVVSSLAFGAMPAGDVPLSASLGASVMLVSAWVLLAQTASSTAQRAVAAGVDALSAARVLERQLDILRWMGLVVSTVCLVGFRLAAAVKTWPGFESSMTLQTLAMLTPGLVITASIWVGEHRYGVAMGYVKSSGFRIASELFSAMLATGGWILLPVFAILIGTDLLGYSGWFDEQAAAAIISVVAIVCIPLLLPVALGTVWKTRPVAEFDRQWIGMLLESCEMRHLPVRVWDTGMRSYNAVVAGFFPRLRSMIVTDRLFAELPRGELAMVILHEVAHVRRYHVWLRMLVMVPSWAVAGFVSATFPVSPTVTIVSNLAAVAATLLSLRWVAHATEYDADRYACLLSIDLPVELQPPADRHAAADRFCRALRRATQAERAPGKGSWLHPSVNNRCERLEVWACEDNLQDAMIPDGFISRSQASTGQFG